MSKPKNRTLKAPVPTSSRIAGMPISQAVGFDVQPKRMTVEQLKAKLMGGAK